jgi:hypothetical protein
MTVLDLFKGASPSQLDLCDSVEESPSKSQAHASDTNPDAPRCWVIGGSNIDIQGQALRLQAMMGGLELKESVTE